MPSSPSRRHLAGVVAAICDAIRAFAIDDDSDQALTRIREALAALGRGPDLPERAPDDESPLVSMLAAVKDLARAQEILAGPAADLAETVIAAAADRLETAAAAIEMMKPNGLGSSGTSVQLSVSEALRIPNEEAIANALENLLNRSESEAFVIFVDARSGNVVQFIGSKGGPLFLDLPFASLGEEEIRRASAYFEEKGFADAEGEEGFSVGLERDVEAGTSLALGVFQHVYHADPDFSLKIEEN